MVLASYHARTLSMLVVTNRQKVTGREIELLDNMLSGLVDLLIEKGIITEGEYEKRVKNKVKIK